MEVGISTQCINHIYNWTRNGIAIAPAGARNQLTSSQPGIYNVEASIDQIAEHYKTSIVDRLDGLTVDVGNWWFNLRPSNTEPLLRLNIEANNNKICAQAIEEVRTLLSQ